MNIIFLLIIISLIYFVYKNKEKYQQINCLKSCMPYGIRSNANYAGCYIVCNRGY